MNEKKRHAPFPNCRAQAWACLVFSVSPVFQPRANFESEPWANFEPEPWLNLALAQSRLSVNWINSSYHFAFRIKTRNLSHWPSSRFTGFQSVSIKGPSREKKTRLRFSTKNKKLAMNFFCKLSSKKKFRKSLFLILTPLSKFFLRASVSFQFWNGKFLFGLCRWMSASRNCS